MKPARLLPASLLAVLASLTLSTLGALPAAAADAAGATAGEAHLHQAFKACGKKWAKKAQRLDQDQLRWMLTRSHRIYHVEVGGEKIASLEILSTASFRNCDVLVNWDKRETSVRVTLFQPDGSTRVRLANFAIDDIFFDRAPTFYPQLGRVLLRGVGFDGRELNRWLEIDAMRPIYAHHTASRRGSGLRSDTAPAPVVTASLD